MKPRCGKAYCLWMRCLRKYPKRIMKNIATFSNGSTKYFAGLTSTENLPNGRWPKCIIPDLTASLEEVQEIASRHKSSIPSSYNIYDVYVAMNASYHDFCKLYKTWFPDNFKEKIIETAITFWFKDEDYGEGKVWDYFDD